MRALERRQSYSVVPCALSCPVLCALSGAVCLKWYCTVLCASSGTDVTQREVAARGLELLVGAWSLGAVGAVGAVGGAGAGMLVVALAKSTRQHRRAEKHPSAKAWIAWLLCHWGCSSTSMLSRACTSMSRLARCLLVDAVSCLYRNPGKAFRV